MPTADKLGVASVIDVLTGIFHLEGTQRGDEYDIFCPNPAHPERHPSTSVNLETGLWNCFSCGAAGDLVSLGVYAMDLPQATKQETRESRAEVEQLLKPRSPDALRLNVARKLALATEHRTAPEAASGAALGPWERGPLTYLRGRGFAQETLRRWEVQFVPEQQLESKARPGEFFTIQNSIAIPIKDEHNTTLSWCFRATHSSPDWQPRYLYPKDADISEMWFGLQHHSDAEEISIVEGALDCMWLDQCGFPALGLMGSQMGDRKIRWLSRYKKVTILGDRDAGGLAVVQKIGNMIGNRTKVEVCRYVRWMGDDPQNLFPVDVEIVHAKAMPWTRWVMEGRTA